MTSLKGIENAQPEATQTSTRNLNNFSTFYFKPSSQATRLKVPDEAYEGHTISWNVYASAADERDILRKTRLYGI
ncbi:hypothetical protein IEQ34_020000 [Dendrobium chrysotoxum]|uniref:Uncharacterized protein n=1 Tax=Dendrobium chrysotoxum TaxID=161865 RepID=A0AAV7G8F5_DENCH|nr:hypothetical protein IEQ34_020000 [Dendrobium chrysotoxum]